MPDEDTWYFIYVWNNCCKYFGIWCLLFAMLKVIFTVIRHKIYPGIWNFLAFSPVCSAHQSVLNFRKKNVCQFILPFLQLSKFLRISEKKSLLHDVGFALVTLCISFNNYRRSKFLLSKFFSKRSFQGYVRSPYLPFEILKICALESFSCPRSKNFLTKKGLPSDWLNTFFAFFKIGHDSKTCRGCETLADPAYSL